MADDELLIAHIHRLVDEEREIRAHGPADQERLHEIDVTLDQCWDLLRQRRAHRDAGEVDTSDLRDAKVVEGYQQ